MRLMLPKPPHPDLMNDAITGFCNSARLWSDADSYGTTERASQYKLAGWHRMFRTIEPGEPAEPGTPAGLRWDGWCVFVMRQEKIESRVMLSRPDAEDTSWTQGITHGPAIDAWVSAIANAENHAGTVYDTSFEVALLLVPLAKATGLLLLSSKETYVWAVMKEAKFCQSGLQPLDVFLGDCDRLCDRWKAEARPSIA